MADYLAPTAGLEGDWSGASGTAGNTTLAVNTDVAVIVFDGFDFSGDTAAVTLDGNAADDVLQADNGGDGAAVFVFANPTTGSSLAIAWSGMDAGDSGSWFVAGVSDADAAEIAATGYPATGSDVNGDPVSIAVTTAVDDLVVVGGQAFNVAAGDIWTAGAGETEVAERFNDDSHGYLGYEKATGTTTTITASAGEAVQTVIAVVIPTAAAAAGFARGKVGSNLAESGGLIG